MSEFFATNAPDPPHWTLNPCFNVFRSICVHLGSFHYCTKLGAKRGWTGVINAKVCATKSCRNFSKRMHPIHPHWTLNHVLVRFVVFGYIWDRFVTAWNSVQNKLNLKYTKWTNIWKNLTPLDLSQLKVFLGIFLEFYIFWNSNLNFEFGPDWNRPEPFRTGLTGYR